MFPWAGIRAFVNYEKIISFVESIIDRMLLKRSLAVIWIKGVYLTVNVTLWNRLFPVMNMHLINIFLWNIVRFW